MRRLFAIGCVRQHQPCELLKRDIIFAIHLKVLENPQNLSLSQVHSDPLQQVHKLAPVQRIGRRLGVHVKNRIGSEMRMLSEYLPTVLQFSLVGT